ncbi:MAG: thiamine phosphate synthase [Deltaproteobacteria bacterium]|nr:thiamine phosphate synthase [Deltaproteobacteria bacterium]
MRGLYAIIDAGLIERRGLDPLRFAAAVLAAAPVAVQLRDKRGSAGATLELLRRLQPVCRAAGVPLFANDRADLAALAGCDGVHLGQQDLPAPLARQVLAATGDAPGRERVVGVSAHNEAELDRALAWQPSYVAFGPVFHTQSKRKLDPVLGLEGLETLVRSSRSVRADLPTVAIGGIDQANAAAVAAICPCVAAIGALVPDEGAGPACYAEVQGRALALARALGPPP